LTAVLQLNVGLGYSNLFLRKAYLLLNPPPAPLPSFPQARLLIDAVDFGAHSTCRKNKRQAVGATREFRIPIFCEESGALSQQGMLPIDRE